MAKGRAVTIVLEGAEKSELTALTRKHGAPRALAERARFVLAAAAAAQQQGDRGRGECLCRNGRHMGNRFAESRMDGLYDEPRPGAPREIGDDEIATTIRKTLKMLADHGHGDRPRDPRPYIASGKPSGCSRTASRPSSSRPIRCSWRRT
jgi:hypothetical protein